MNNLSPIFMVKKNHQYSITMDFVRDIAIAYIRDDETYVSTISIQKRTWTFPKSLTEMVMPSFITTGMATRPGS